jgi:hypothetical protein
VATAPLRSLVSGSALTIPQHSLLCAISEHKAELLQGIRGVASLVVSVVASTTPAIAKNPGMLFKCKTPGSSFSFARWTTTSTF